MQPELETKSGSIFYSPPSLGLSVSLFLVGPAPACHSNDDDDSPVTAALMQHKIDLHGVLRFPSTHIINKQPSGSSEFRRSSPAIGSDRPLLRSTPQRAVTATRHFVLSRLINNIVFETSGLDRTRGPVEGKKKSTGKMKSYTFLPTHRPAEIFTGLIIVAERASLKK